MFCNFYGLTEKPFNIIPNPGILYESEKHKQALNYLRYGFSENIGFVLFTGEIGTGKTTLLKFLLTDLTTETEVAVVFNTNVDAEELLRLILIEFEIQGIGTDKSQNLDLLNQHLIDTYRQGKRCLLIIDEAQNLSADALEEVRLLSNLQTDTQPLLQIILAGQPELRDIIQGPGLEQLAQRVAINYHLTPLSREELGEYIEYRLKQAGSEDGKLFSSEAVDLLYAHTGGIPRSVNVLCNAALVYGYADSLEQVPTSIVQQVIEDNIGIETQSSSAAPTVDTLLYPATASSSDVTSHDHTRISQLESQVAKLTAMVNWQSGQVDGALAKGHEKLIKSLTDLLDEERNRSERYYGRYIALYHKYKALQLKLEDEEKGKQTDCVDKIQPNEREKGFFSSLQSIFAPH